MKQLNGTRRVASRRPARTVRAAAGGVLLLLLGVPAAADVRFFEISGSTAASENFCPIWVPEDNFDDCSYHAGDPFGLGTDQWIGPLFSAGYYAPGEAPAIFSIPEPPDPVISPDPVLPIGGKTGIPIARGFITIDDRGTASGSDDRIGGTLEFGAHERNLATGPLTRAVESAGRIIHRIVPATVTSATPNAGGGFDYVLAQFGFVAAFPAPLDGPTDAFPSEIASQSSRDDDDEPYWDAPGEHGIARIDGNDSVIGTRTSATVWDYSCDAGGGPCATNELFNDGDARASYDNVLLRFSTDGAGNLTGAQAFLVREADLSDIVIGDDSWLATTLEFTGVETSTPVAFDDRAIHLAGRASTTTAVLANDLPGTLPVTVTIVSQPASGTAEVLTGEPNANAIRYTPAGTSPAGTEEQIITYEIRDATGATSSATLQVLVTDVLRCTDDAASGPRNAPVTIDVLDNDSGADIPPVSLRIFSDPPAGTAVVNPDLSVTFTPPADTGGIFPFIYRIIDGANQPVICNVSVQIEADPEAVDDVYGIVRDTATTLDVLANDLEVTDTPLTLEITADPGHGTAVVETSGSRPAIRYTPEGGYLGPDSLSYRVEDADGESSAATVSLTVFGEPETDLPACTDDTVTAERNAATVIDVLANDTGLNAAPISVTVDALQPATATAEVNPDNTITFTPPPDTGGEFLLAYTARESLNEPVGCVATIRVNDIPIARDDEFQVNFGQRTFVPWGTNDAGLSDLPVALEITQQPLHGTVTVQEGDLQAVLYLYDDAGSFPAADSFRYRLRDADGDTSEEAEVTLTPVNVLRANDDPDTRITTNEDFSTATGHRVTVDVLANDGGLLHAPIALEVVGAVNGTAVVNPDNTVTFTPAAGFAGTAGFSYQLTDAEGSTDIAEVTVFVFAAPVTDLGGSSSLDEFLLALLAGALPLWALRRSRRLQH